MADSIWTATLEQFRDRMASHEPVLAGVTAAAVSATLALALLSKVLQVTLRHKDFIGDPNLVGALLDDTQKTSVILSHLADDDVAAFQHYLDCVRNKQPTGSALRKTIEVPLNVARAASLGITLCEKSAGHVHAVVAPDLRIASALLEGAVRSALVTLKSNLEQLPSGDRYRNEVTEEALRLAAKSERRPPAGIADERL
jgi:formiminotetrahydrofolate cyclodeaminase